MKAPYWGLLTGAWSAEACAGLLAEAESSGWRPGTYADGTTRPNVLVAFLNEASGPVSRAWLKQLRDRSVQLAGLWGVTVEPAGLVQLQISRWGLGDHYGMHADHDATGNLGIARKLSIYVSLADGGGLEVDKVGHVRCNTGDCLVFSALTQHAVPALDPTPATPEGEEPEGWETDCPVPRPGVLVYGAAPAKRRGRWCKPELRDPEKPEPAAEGTIYLPIIEPVRFSLVAWVPGPDWS